VARTADAIDLSSRTLTLKWTSPTRTGQLLPEAYAQVHLQSAYGTRLQVPVNALLFRAGGAARVVVDANHKTHLQQLAIAGLRHRVGGASRSFSP